MGLIVLLFFSWILYKDAQILQLRDRQIYERRLLWPAYAWFISGFLLSVFVWPVYVLRRFQFHKDLEQRPDPGLQRDPRQERLSLVSEGTGILIAWFLGMGLFSLVLVTVEVFVPLLKTTLNQMLILGTFSSIWFVVLIAMTVRPFTLGGFLDKVSLRTNRRPLVKIVLVPLAFGIILGVLSSWITIERPHKPVTPLDEALKTADSSTSLIVFAAMAVLVAPLLEEIVFRGYFFAFLEKMKGKVFAITAVSLIFAYLHVGQYWGDWLAIVVITIMGFSLTLLRSWTGSAIPSTITHYLYNALLIIVPILSASNVSYMRYQILYDYLKPQQRQELLKESIRRDPGFNEAYNDLAWHYAKAQKNLDEALALVNRALRNDARNEAYLDTKAEVLYQMGRREEAVAIEKDLVYRYPNNAFYKQQLRRFRGQGPGVKEGSREGEGR